MNQLNWDKMGFVEEGTLRLSDWRKAREHRNLYA